MPERDGLRRGQDSVVRCWWCGEDHLYVSYHDQEWGFPSANDRLLFEHLCLEGFQSGLSWFTILRKRENFRRAFRRWNVEAIARFGPRDVERLMNDAGIIRNRSKIESAINNARRALEVIDEAGSLATFMWRYEPSPKSRPRRMTYAALMVLTTSPESVTLSKELKRRGWSFVGPTGIYAFMQGVGIVDDHLHGCAIRTRVEAVRTRFLRPV